MNTTYKLARTPAALQIGGAGPQAAPVYFDGDESLCTIAAPGTGKTAAQVIPNLLTYPGSCFVLDVKGELWDKTAGHRARAFGPVYRFAPTDPGGFTHRYNPLDIVPREVAAAERECQIIASMIIPDAKRDPFWSDKAREYLWAFLMGVTFTAQPGYRHLGSISQLFALPTQFADDNAFLNSDTHHVLSTLRVLAEQFGVPALAQAANSFADTKDTDKLLQSVLETARSKLGPLTRSPTALAAMSGSDWHPLDLRRRPGTTVYFCLKPDELMAYAPLVRLVFQQHVSQLCRHFSPKKGELPITFFLDEMPQLGHMPNLATLIEVGRGAAVRLWMFMQYIGQMRSAYDKAADGLIGACRVRCYMSPDKETSETMVPLLGETENLFSGEKRKLATAAELAGPAFANDIITLAHSEHPARFSKAFYFKDKRLLTLSQLPPPVVKPVPRAVPQPQAATA